MIRSPRAVTTTVTVATIALVVALAGACATGREDAGDLSTPATATQAAGSDAPGTSASTGTTPGSSSPSTGSCAATDQIAHRDEVYATTDADPKLTSLDVYEAVRPEGCGPAPILFWVHGGGWQQGDKGNQLSDKKRLAAEQGWTLVSLNYRLTPAVQYPVPNQDVADGIGWFLAHAAQFNADPSRTAVMGHSAGGGIVAAVSTDERYLANAGRSLDDLDCLVSLDTEGYDVTKKGDDGGIYDAMFGTDPAAWPDQSPVNHVRAGAGIPDTFIVTRGSAARLANAHAFADALTTAGVPTTIIETRSLDHNGVNDAVGAPEDTLITPKLVPFLDACLGTPT